MSGDFEHGRPSDFKAIMFAKIESGNRNKYKSN